MSAIREPDGARPRTRSGLPEDRFDRVPRGPRVGAHRIAAKPRRFWIFAVAALMGIAILTSAGIIALTTLGSGLGTFSSEGAGGEEPAVEEIQAQLDPEATVAVLNGTATPNLQAGVDAVITQNAWGSIIFSDAAASQDVEISAVFFLSPDDEPAARGLAEKLGGVSTYQSDAYADYGATLVVLLGADYAGPGFDEAAEITARLESGAAAPTAPEEVAP